MTNLFLTTDFFTVLMFYVRRAMVNIYISAYVIKGNQRRSSDPLIRLISLLELKKKQGVDIKILIDNPPRNRPNFAPNRVFFRYLYDRQFQLCINNGFSTAHAKTISIDGKYLFIGSHNLTQRSFYNPLEASVLLELRDVVTANDINFLKNFNNTDFRRFPPEVLNIDRIYP